jgi:transposase InsO family protein
LRQCPTTCRNQTRLSRGVAFGTDHASDAGTAQVDASERSSLKKELVKKQIYKSRDLATAAIGDYIKTFYNRSRRHRHLGGISPEQFETAHKSRKQGVH